ncbi:hypothetical protein INT08_08740 [Prosthecochloris sp. N3]|uniref:Porin n=1 Tax=Prosthecochloris ethylica TaxID=2743976 RepID=A0ABR9XU18_9CHLB|nr:hypothetical protein [Prosthecochloris ethylica]MBF0587178.1 hypothetical protein [Prosthecochloris ethylica]MBF0637256.1 hypothetical protein [Prosthecochloris ethylica]
MKKLLSLAFALVLISQASPASAAIKFSGDAQVRPRFEMLDYEVNDYDVENTENLKYYYRLRLKAAADLGDGYFAKALISSETPGWLATVSDANSEKFDLGVSQLYFGRMMENSHYMMGRMPLGSLNNPVFDITMYPFQATEIPVFLYNNDRLYGFNYGTKVGPGELNATLCILNNDASHITDAWDDNEDDVLEDGYALHVSYKTNIGNVTFQPQLLAALTGADIAGGAYIDSNMWGMGAYQDVAPITFGANATIPAGSTTFTVSGFYSFVDGEGYEFVADGEDPCCGTVYVAEDRDVDYHSYLFRVKAQNGPVTAWFDYNAATDETGSSDVDYSNMFVWAQYNWKVHESSMGSFTVSPTVRYLASEVDNGTETNTSRLRTELWAQVTF